jgi:hypothetical protein
MINVLPLQNKIITPIKRYQSILSNQWKRGVMRSSHRVTVSSTPLIRL